MSPPLPRAESRRGPTAESADVARGPQRGAEVRALADQLQAAEQLLAAARLENEHLEALQVELREGLSQPGRHVLPWDRRRKPALVHADRPIRVQTSCCHVMGIDGCGTLRPPQKVVMGLHSPICQVQLL